MNKIKNIYLAMYVATGSVIGIGNISTSIYSLFDKKFQLNNSYFYCYNKTDKYQTKLENFMVRTFIICPMKMCVYGIFFPITIPYTIVGFIDDPKRQFTNTFTPGGSL